MKGFASFSSSRNRDATVSSSSSSGVLDPPLRSTPTTHRLTSGDDLSLDDDLVSQSALLRADPFAVMWSGRLHKRGHLIKSWKIRHVVLRGGMFIYWNSEYEFAHRPANPTGVALVTDVAEWEQVDGLGLSISTEGADGSLKKFYLRALSQEDKPKAFRGATSTLAYGKSKVDDIMATHGPNVNRDVCLGVLYGQAAFFDESVKCISRGVGRVEFGRRPCNYNHFMLGNAYFARWEEGGNVDEELVNDAITQFEVSIELSKKQQAQAAAAAELATNNGTDDAAGKLPAGRVPNVLNPIRRATSATPASSSMSIGAMSQFNLSTIYYLLGSFSSALQGFNHLLESPTAVILDSDRADLLVNVAFVALAERRYADALSTVDRALALCPSCGAAHTTAGDVHFLEGRQSEAVESYARAVAALPDVALVRVKAAKALFYSGRREEAVQKAKEAVELEADVNGEAFNFLIVLLGSMDMKSDVIALKAQQNKEGSESLQKRMFAKLTNT